jgi:hypothetical protein
MGWSRRSRRCSSGGRGAASRLGEITAVGKVAAGPALVSALASMSAYPVPWRFAPGAGAAVSDGRATTSWARAGSRDPGLWAVHRQMHGERVQCSPLAGGGSPEPRPEAHNATRHGGRVARNPFACSGSADPPPNARDQATRGEPAGQGTGPAGHRPLRGNGEIQTKGVTPCSTK